MQRAATTFRVLTPREAESLLRRHHVGRIAFRNGPRVDVEPISYVSEDGAIYGRAAPGTRMTALGGQPWVAFQVDDIRGPFDWESVVARGTVYVVEPGMSALLDEHYEKALRVIRSAMPDALTARDPVPARTILFRIHIDELEGRAAGHSATAGPRSHEPLGAT
jgi:nitroimidazol reductase NimA-like FMN-containing flavoprotein (pyridoxamine 5'-phosphate oxidase superfamily)